MVTYTGTQAPEWGTVTETPLREQIVRFSVKDRGNVSKDDMQRLLDAGFIAVFVEHLPTIVPNPTTPDAMAVQL